MLVNKEEPIFKNTDKVKWYLNCFNMNKVYFVADNIVIVWKFEYFFILLFFCYMNFYISFLSFILDLSDHYFISVPETFYIQLGKGPKVKEESNSQMLLYILAENRLLKEG